MNNENNSFSYTYSAKQQEEIRKIRKKYMPPEEDKMEQLRRLDRSVYDKGTAAALIYGIIGTLILGIGMCCTMVWQDSLFIPGIIVGITGIVLICCAYPIYKHIIKKERKKIASEVIRLTDELMK